MTLTEFLTARLDEYEAALDDATSGPPFSPVGTSGGVAVDVVLSRADVYDIDERVAWLRRDVAAKRCILHEHREEGRGDHRGCNGCGWAPGDEVRRNEISGCPTLRALASVYADYPGYDQEWAL